ncbi:hypothetical protein ACHAWU_006428 [Discostella pseudostelligera]|uniref:Uncharacterized protein n=1 Tax=Discostella pseudostelligera TaxID=259834 RepID=A0ABD3M7R1_9STRA
MATTTTMFLLAVAILLTDRSHALSLDKKPFLRRIRTAIAPFTLPWYEDGLNFSCTGCGKCCKVDGDVWLAPEEVNNIMVHLGYSNNISEKTKDDNESSITNFRKKYIRAEVSPTDGDESQSWMCLKRKEGACIFLDQSGQCSIYAARPVQCKTYPFWPSLLIDQEAWEDEAVLPDNIDIREGTGDRHWCPDQGGCEGIILRKSDDDSEASVDVQDYEESIGSIVDRKEIQLKMKEAARHWKRFPVQEIRESTWYL